MINGRNVVIELRDLKRKEIGLSGSSLEMEWRNIMRQILGSNLPNFLFLFSVEFEFTLSHISLINLKIKIFFEIQKFAHAYSSFSVQNMRQFPSSYYTCVYASEIKPIYAVDRRPRSSVCALINIASNPCSTTRPINILSPGGRRSRSGKCLTQTNNDGGELRVALSSLPLFSIPLFPTGCV